jgi:hypothetical protein
MGKNQNLQKKQAYTYNTEYEVGLISLWFYKEVRKDVVVRKGQIR